MDTSNSASQDQRQQIITILDAFFAPFPLRQFQPGELILQPEPLLNHIYYLKSGTVKVYTINQNGDELTLNLYRDHAFFPMSVAINHTPNPYFYEATQATELHIAPSEQVIAFVKSQPEVLYDLLSRVYRGLDGLLLRQTYLLAGNKYANVITELLIAAKRFGSLNDQGHIVLPVNQKDVASQSGMARETVSREMKILKDKGLISFDNQRLTIFNLDKLEAELYQNS